MLPICLSNNIAQSKLPKPELERMMTNLRIFNQLTNDFNPMKSNSTSLANQTTLKRFDDVVSCLAGSRIILNPNSFNLVNYDHSTFDTKGRLSKSMTNNQSMAAYDASTEINTWLFCRKNKQLCDPLSTRFRVRGHLLLHPQIGRREGLQEEHVRIERRC